ncbi:MAG: Hsp33 family molecular chaperone HslO [Eubacteriales bacterium]|nr:Hsp33 family molecular chaperone HslO [Eubacteriales bacterium]
MDNMLNKDGMVRISLMEGQARALLIDSTRLVEEARRIHSLSRTATAALGRTLTGASMMGAMLKDERDSLTLMIKGGGPIGTVMAVARSDGSVKGYVDWPDTELERRPDGKLNVGGAVGKNGQLTVIKDLGLREPYVGKTNLVSGEIAEDLAMYFTASEQTPSLVSLGVLVKDQVLAAGGLIIQVMPDCSEIALKSIENSAPMFMDISKTIADYGLDGALEQLLCHLEPQVLDRLTPVYRCDCSRERFARGLISLGKKELTQLIEEDHGATLDCHFCNKRYRFDEAQLRELLANATRE